MNSVLYLGRDPYDLTYDWKEWHLQAYVVMQSRRLNITVHGDQNGASKTPKGWSQGQATGMLKGWPDLCFVLNRLVFVELKLLNGTVSKEQKAIHGSLKAAGQLVHVVHSSTPGDCWDQIQKIIKDFC